MEENIHRMLVLENLSFDRGENRGLGALVALLGSQGDKNSGLLTQPRALSTIQPSLEPTWVGGGGGWVTRAFPGKTLLVFALLHSVFQGQMCLLLQVFLDFLLLHSSPL